MCKYYYHDGEQSPHVKACALLGWGSRNGHNYGVVNSKPKAVRIRPFGWPKTDWLLIHADCLFARHDTRLAWEKNGDGKGQKPKLPEQAFKKLYPPYERRYRHARER